MRRTIPLMVSSTLALGLLAVIPAAPAAAQPSCEGRTATITDNGPGDNDPRPGFIEGTNGRDIIVGTNGDDFIEGKGGKDLICGRRGLDSIDGGNKRDRIFGGGDNDTIFGGRGADDLFGFKGNDSIFGQKGNDFINGGRGTDECYQGEGRGPIRQCERADLKLVMLDCSYGAQLECDIRVRNRGPQATAYVVDFIVDTTAGVPDCDDFGEFFPKLRAGRSRTSRVSQSCDPDPNSSADIKATVHALAKDRRFGNDEKKDGVDFD